MLYTKHIHLRFYLLYVWFRPWNCDIIYCYLDTAVESKGCHWDFESFQMNAFPQIYQFNINIDKVWQSNG